MVIVNKDDDLLHKYPNPFIIIDGEKYYRTWSNVEYKYNIDPFDEYACEEIIGYRSYFFNLEELYRLIVSRHKELAYDETGITIEYSTNNKNYYFFKSNRLLIKRDLKTIMGYDDFNSFYIYFNHQTLINYTLNEFK